MSEEIKLDDKAVHKMDDLSVKLAKAFADCVNEFTKKDDGKWLLEVGYVDSVVLRAATMIAMNSLSNLDDEVQMHAFGTFVTESSSLLMQIKLSHANEASSCDTQH